MRAFSQLVVRRRKPTLGLAVLGGLCLSAVILGAIAAERTESEPPEKPAPPAAAAVRRPARSESGIARLDLTDKSNERDLVQLVRDETKRASLRYSALRRLEDAEPKESVRLAEELARKGGSSKDAEFLWTNAIALLYRSKMPEGRSALERARRSSPEAETLVTLLEKQGR